MAFAAKMGRYELRSSQRANDDSQQAYETQRMDFLDSAENAQLSQSDLNRVDSQQLEQYLCNSFGGKFSNLGAVEESNPMGSYARLPKEEEEPTLMQYNYAAEMMNPQSIEQNDQFIPYDEAGMGDFLQNGSEAFKDPYGPDSFSGFVFSQDRNQQYQFGVVVQPQHKTSNQDFIVTQQQVFLKYQTAVPFNFVMADPNTKTDTPFNPNHFIRLSLRYDNPSSDDKKIVGRCHVHVNKDISGAHRLLPFIVNHRAAVYDEEKLSVTIPVVSVVSLTFFCYSSCAGGMDRQPVHLLFELLNEDGSFAQETRVKVKVCANPSRDAQAERDREQRQRAGGRAIKSETGVDSAKKAKKRKTTDEREDETGAGEAKRQDSNSPMPAASAVNTPRPSPGWTPTMSAPRASAASRRSSKLNFRSESSEGGGGHAEAKASPACKEESPSDDDEVRTIYVKGKKKYEELTKFLKTLEQNERYSARYEEENPFENLTQLTGEIAISTWLDQYRLSDEAFLVKFRSMGVETLGDVQRVFTPSLFESSIGMNRRAASHLNRVYLNWINVNM